MNCSGLVEIMNVMRHAKLVHYCSRTYPMSAARAIANVTLAVIVEIQDGSGYLDRRRLKAFLRMGVTFLMSS